MNNVKRNTFAGRLSAAWRNFWRTLKGQATSTINIGVQVNRCDDCLMEAKERLKESEVARADLGKRLAAAQQELHEVKSELEKVKAERDVLFEQVRGYCYTCKRNHTDFDCHVKCYGHQRGSAWEWNGGR